MTSTFHGLQTAKRALQAQQAGLYTTGNNVANANTPGYTRQRINLTPTDGYPPASLNRPAIPGQIGTGVTAGAVQRIREFFLDTQYRKENAQLGYYGTNADALAKLEDILNETGKKSSGIARVLNDFWQSLQDLSANPENSGARDVVIQRGHAVADTFNYISNTIEDYREDLWSQISTDQQTINSILTRVHELNKQIAEMEPLGYLPNNLYDERDLLVDELSGYLDIEVEQVKPKPEELSNKSIAGMVEGIYVIKLKGVKAEIPGDDPPNTTTYEEVKLVDKDGINELAVDRDAPGESYVTEIKFGTYKLTKSDNGIDNFLNALPQGKLKSLVENYGYGFENPPPVSPGDPEHTTKGTYLKWLNEIKEVARTFIDEVNAQHSLGFKADGTKASEKLFDMVNLGEMEFSLTDSKELAFSGNGTIGDGSNAKNIADKIEAAIRKYETMTGKLAVDAQFQNRQKTNVGALRDTVDQKRLSVSTVSLDEEMMNMIKYQHAYNAAARNITVIDEMLDKIINGMGIVGR